MDVSIVIPVYNVKDYIVRCLKCVSAQTFRGSMECIIVDDCGCDNSIDLAEKNIAQFDSCFEFRILHQEYNQGPSAARNRGIREAKGKYIFFLDADDMISNDCIELLFNLASKYNLDYVQGMYHRDENYHMPVYKSQDCNHPYRDKKAIKKMMLDYSYIPYTPHNRLVRRQILMEYELFFPEEIKVRDDFYWMFFLAKYVESMTLCDKVTYFREFNNESLTHNINKDREIIAYQTVIDTFCSNIDSCLRGEQKILILDTLIMAINKQYYADEIGRKKMIDTFKKENNMIEQFFLNVFFILKDGFLKSKILHLLLCIYRRN